MEPSLGRFFADMALDPTRLAGFLDNPEGLMAAASLPEEVREILRHPDELSIAERLSMERGGPMSVPWQAPAFLVLMSP